MLAAGLEVNYVPVIPESPGGGPQPKARPSEVPIQPLPRPPGLPEPDAVPPIQPAVTQLGVGVSSGPGAVPVTQGGTDNLGIRDIGAESLQVGQGDVAGEQGAHPLAGRQEATEERSTTDGN